ncbi:ankyrin repeat domain-containing protein [Halioxenophilus sp. WMMB6]|uniref:ankyrin repeat domain-containing protein n=1 Tax=Halioxenophilus sp. WMMB6 TaxID=3073815 RepID=UPI00295EF308|nr:ankyrin repeat domain-containing protein [Halioxenophilus sp. WMMB6]
MSGFKEVDLKSAEKVLAEENILVLDVRDRLSYRCGHIPNAINFGKDNLKMFLQNINKHLTLLIYGEGEQDAEAIAELLVEFGFQNVLVLAGGYDLWAQNHQAKMPKHVCDWLNDNGYSCDDLDRRGFNGETALMLAARQGRTEYVVELIDRGASLDITNNDGNSAVWLACYGNDPHTLQALIEAGADINQQNDNGATSLIYAASAGRETMVHILLLAGADHRLATLDDFTALDVASTAKILKLLRQAAKGLPIAEFNAALSLAV